MQGSMSLHKRESNNQCWRAWTWLPCECCKDQHRKQSHRSVSFLF